MPFLQSSGAISINDLRNFFPGLGDGYALSNYYRGGGRTPTTKNVEVREPTSGDYYDRNQTRVRTSYSSSYTTNFRWGNSDVSGFLSGDVVSYSGGGYTYQRSTLRSTELDAYGAGDRYYGIYRTYISTVNINTSIPSSGAIALSQFYGAEKP